DRDVEITGPVLRRRNAQRRRDLFDVRLARHDLRPAAADDLQAVADSILVRISVEAVAVNKLPVRINRGRRCRVTVGRAVVDNARAGIASLGPDDGSVVGVQRDDVAGLGRYEKKVSFTARHTYAAQVNRRSISYARQRRAKGRP